MHCYSMLAVAATLLFIRLLPVTSFTLFVPTRQARIASSFGRHKWQTSYSATADDNEEPVDEDQSERGLKDAFRQLGALQSLDDETQPSNDNKSKPAPIQSNVPEDLDSTPLSTPEQEVKLYKDMVKELESTEEEDLYSTVLADMGGAPKEKMPPAPVVGGTKVKESSEELMNKALEEAIKEVSVTNEKSAVDDILNDKEIMKEIEAIFERGNEQLLESLDEMRREQETAARTEATLRADRVTTDMDADAKRLAVAESAMKDKLELVNNEAQEVAKAVADLEAAKKGLDDNMLLKLRQGGLPKQLSLVGLLLFSVRSIADTLASFSDETHFTAALIQGGLAIVCAIAFFVL